MNKYFPKLVSKKGLRQTIDAQAQRIYALEHLLAEIRQGATVQYQNASLDGAARREATIRRDLLEIMEDAATEDEVYNYVEGLRP
jgi:hypothetical protein